MTQILIALLAIHILITLLAAAIRFRRAWLAERTLSVRDRRVGSWAIYCIPFMHAAARIVRIDYVSMMCER